MNLPGFIGQLLGQYQDLLVRQVEREIKNQAAAAFKEQTYLLRWRALERLFSWESGMQQKLQEILDQVRDQISDVIHQEASEIYGELQATVEALVEEATGGIAEEAREVAPPQVAPEVAPPQVAREVAPQQVAQALASPEGQNDSRNGPGTKNGGKETENGEKEKEEVRPQEVHLELFPPIEAKPLLWFYQGLLENRELSVVRTFGSLERGVSLYIRKKGASPLAELLRTLPGVMAVVPETSQGGNLSPEGERTDNCPTLRIHLIPTEEKATPVTSEVGR